MSILELLSVMVTMAALFGWLSRRWLRLPLTIGIMLLTVIGSLGLVSASNFFPGLRMWAGMLLGAINFENLILHGLLSVLLFAGAFLLDIEALFAENLAIALLSVVGTVASTLITAGVLYLVLPLIGVDGPMIDCLLFGALISPTDPIAVLEMLKRVGAPKFIQAQLAGESLFNDGVGAVIFLALLEASRGATPTPAHFLSILTIEAGGGLALGVALAWLASQLMRRTDAFQVELLLTLALATGGYALADHWHLSAPLAAVAAGIALRRFEHKHPITMITSERIDVFWEVIDEVLNAVLFVLVGFEVLAIPFSRLPLEVGALSVVIVTVARFGVIAAIISLLRWTKKGFRSSIRILSWGGLRGGLSLALALSVPHIPGRTWILVATYSVVLVSIVVQGSSMEWVLKRLLAEETPPAVEDEIQGIS
ncbi:MAG: sodium:proton antiporter [Edaphobacter sp.]|uniref:cation:proton antiporter n=1 Tax=Edaphobacter sp. TaxID=1934404 RepID=UPI00238E27DB|nr:sodium:proton antiporter [Edaphobacter sp.]MDE1176787.1 sodium:proton antiporter [Edaphobacter sp.]